MNLIIRKGNPLFMFWSSRFVWLKSIDMLMFAGNHQATYSLHGVSNHVGSVYSGHYTAYCKHPYNGRWYSYNDSRYCIYVSSTRSFSVLLLGHLANLFGPPPEPDACWSTRSRGIMWRAHSRSWCSGGLGLELVALQSWAKHSWHWAVQLSLVLGRWYGFLSF